MSDISNQLIKDSFNYVLQSDIVTGIVYRIGGSIPVNPIFSSGLTINSGFTYSDGTEQLGYVLTCDAFGNAHWGPTSAVSTSALTYYVSASTPTGVTLYNGDRWFNTTTGDELVWINDGDSSQWIQICCGSNGGGSNITISNRPAFSVYGAGTTNNLTTTQNGTGTLDTNNFGLSYSQGTGFDINTGIFTAPVEGLYQVTLIGGNAGFAGGISQLVVTKNNSNTPGNVMMIEWAASSSMNHTGGGQIFKLEVGETLRLKVLAGQINFDGNDNWSVAYIG